MKKDEKKNLRAVIGYASCGHGAAAGSMEKAEPCGDTVISFRLPEGSQAVILSDGMGHGAAAASESRLAARWLRLFLKQGLPVARAIREVNRLLLEKAGSREMFTTVDLLVLEKEAGRARFYKLGAAPSYVVRGRRIRKVEQAALPVGILPQLKLTHVSARLAAGDIIVMMSDGISDSGGRCPDGAFASGGRCPETSAQDWVISLLDDLTAGGGRDAGIGPRKLAGQILTEAERRCRERDEEMDDATVAVIQIR